MRCSYTEIPHDEKVCEVNIEQWKPCVSTENYNYNRHGACIFLKLNKIFGWKPDIYNSTEDLPENMPAHLQSHIKEKVRQKREMVRNS